MNTGLAMGAANASHSRREPALRFALDVAEAARTPPVASAQSIANGQKLPMLHLCNAGVSMRSSGKPATMPADWRKQLELHSLGTCMRACLVYELVAQRVAGQPVEVTTAALRSAARAEGLDTHQPWIGAAALQMSRESSPTLP